jgi:hypothetical protein
MPGNNPNETSTSDYLEFYKMLHEERVSLAEEARKLELSSVGAVAALYAWLATHAIHGEVWYIAVPLTVLASFRATIIGARILFIKGYLENLESHELFKEPGRATGYETYFQKETKAKWYMHLRYTVVVIWTAIILVTIVAPHLLDKPESGGLNL